MAEPLTKIDRRLQMKLPFNIEIDATVPRDEIRLRDSVGIVHRITNIGVENVHLSDAEKDELLATPRADALSDAIAALQFARVHAIDISVRARQCETNLSVALELLQQLAAER